MVTIQGTQVHKKGGGGIGSLLGSILGGATGALLGGPAGAVAGASAGGSIGGTVGESVSKEETKQLGIPVGGQQPSQAMPDMSPSAVDRINSILGIGTTAYGAYNSMGGGSSTGGVGSTQPVYQTTSNPKIDAMNRWMSARYTPNYMGA